ncbi:MAG TPA: hypothetical protein VFR07_09920 [Mycobacteriales bacterium]|nr:hypothetical protein [Mycobacteriales bacterium]
MQPGITAGLHLAAVPSLTISTWTPDRRLRQTGEPRSRSADPFRPPIATADRNRAAARRITTEHGVLVVEVRPIGVVARVARPEEHPDLSVMTAAAGQDEDEAVGRLRAVLHDLEQGRIRAHVVLPREPDPPDDGLPVFRYQAGREHPGGRPQARPNG